MGIFKSYDRDNVRFKKIYLVSNKNCYSILTYSQLDELIKNRKHKYNTTIVFFKNYLIKGLGIEWIKTKIKLINKEHKNHKIQFYVDCGYDFGLSITLIRNNIDFIKLKSNKIILKKIESIAKQNNVVLNPVFNIENKIFDNNLNRRDRIYEN